jgi:putative ABC transport system permease protein
MDSRTGRIEDVDWPLEREVRRVLAPRHEFSPSDRNAVAMWDTTLQTLMFSRMVQTMKDFFTIVGLVTLALGGLGVMNIMLVAVQERTREIGVRKALGATTRQIQRQFFLEGFLLTMISGALGFAMAFAICAAVNTLPMPPRFQGMTVTWQAGLSAVAALAFVGIVTSTYPARRAARLPPVEALRYEG